MRVNISSSGAFKRDQRADDLVHVAAGAEVVAGAGDHHRMHVVGLGAAGANRSRSSAYESKVSGFLRSGRFSVSVATPLVDLPAEVLGLVVAERLAVAAQQRRIDAVGGVAGVLVDGGVFMPCPEVCSLRIRCTRSVPRWVWSCSIGARVEPGEQFEQPLLVLARHRLEGAAALGREPDDEGAPVVGAVARARPCLRARARRSAR